MVLRERFELSRLAALVPKTSVSAIPPPEHMFIILSESIKIKKYFTNSVFKLNSITMQNIELHWGTPIIRDNIIFDSHDELEKAAIEYSGRTNDDQAFFNPKHNIEQDDRLVDLKQYVLEFSLENVKKLNEGFWAHEINVEFADLWSWSSTDYYNPYHSHPNCSWSFIYMIDPGDPERDGYNGNTLLYSPMPWGSYADPGIAFMERTYMQWHRLNKGDIILFPSYVRHSAKYNGTVPRTLIAGNLKFS